MEHDVHQQQQQQQQVMDLPPGFRFHPTDEELITHYLAQKAADPSFTARAVGEADLNKCEPWDLPSRATMGEKEWYFFVVKDRKYPTGTRTNRATESGYWKATGKDREIFRGKVLVGMKKTLVFYTGRAPRGGKTGWVMHEYRLDGRHATTASRAAASKDEWVLCRVFEKSLEPSTVAGNGKKSASNMGMSASDDVGRLAPFTLPPLIDVAAAGVGGGITSHPASSFATPTPLTHVTCFSHALEGPFLNPPFLQSATVDHHRLTMVDDGDAASPFFATMQMHYTQAVAVSGPPGMPVHDLLDGSGGWYSNGERERLSGASQDTGLTSEQVNPTEISSSRQQMDHEPSLWGY